MFLKKKSLILIYFFLFIFILLILSLFINIRSCSEEKEQNDTNNLNSTEIGIVLTERTVLRLDPIIYSSIVTYLKKGTEVNIFDRSKKTSWIGKTEDYWYKVAVPKGLVGWIFGTNIKIFKSNNKEEVDEFISDIWDQELLRLKKELSGKWWSIDENGNYTDHCLLIFRGGGYKSYQTGKDPFTGYYNFNFLDNEIIFLNGASFGDSLDYLKKGRTYILKRSNKREELNFKRISKRIKKADLEPELKKEDNGKQDKDK